MKNGGKYKLSVRLLAVFLSFLMVMSGGVITAAAAGVRGVSLLAEHVTANFPVSVLSGLLQSGNDSGESYGVIVTDLSSLAPEGKKYSQCSSGDFSVIREFLGVSTDDTLKLRAMFAYFELHGYSLYESISLAGIACTGIFTAAETVALSELYPDAGSLKSFFTDAAPFILSFGETLARSGSVLSPSLYSAYVPVFDENTLSVRAAHTQYITAAQGEAARLALLAGKTVKETAGAFSAAAWLGIPVSSLLTGRTLSEITAALGRSLNSYETSLAAKFGIDIQAVYSALSALRTAGESLTLFDLAGGLSGTQAMYAAGDSGDEDESAEPVPPCYLSAEYSGYIDISSGASYYRQSVASVAGYGDFGLELNAVYNSADAVVGTDYYHPYWEVEAGYYAEPCNGGSMIEEYWVATFSAYEDALQYSVDNTYEYSDGEYCYYYSASAPIAPHTEYSSWSITEGKADFRTHGWKIDRGYVDVDNSNYITGVYLPEKGYVKYEDFTAQGYTRSNSYVYLHLSSGVNIQTYYHVTDRDGNVYYFSSSKNIIAQTDLCGNAVYYTYSSQGTTNRISAVSLCCFGNTQTVNITWSESAGATTVTSPDGSSVVFTRSQVAYSPQSGISCPYYAITSVTNAAGEATSFAYTVGGNSYPEYIYYEPEDFYYYTYCNRNAAALLETVTYAGGARLCYEYSVTPTETGGRFSCYVSNTHVEYGSAPETVLYDTDYIFEFTTTFFGFHIGRLIVENSDGTAEEHIANNKGLFTTVNKYKDHVSASEMGTLVSTYTFTGSYSLPLSKQTVTYVGNTGTVREQYTYTEYGAVASYVSKRAYDTSAALYAVNYTYTQCYMVGIGYYYYLPATVSWRTDADTQVLVTNTYTSDEKHLASSVTTVNGVASARTDYTYDSAGRLITVKEYTDPANDTEKYITTSYTYGAINPQSSISGLYVTLETVSGVADADGAAVGGGSVSTAYTYDACGRLLSKSSGGRTVSYTYDGCGRLTQTAYPDGSTETTTYNAADNTTTVTNRAGGATVYDYDPSGLLSAVIRKNGAGDSDDTTLKTCTYNAEGKLYREYIWEDAGTASVREYTYNSLGETASVTLTSSQSGSRSFTESSAWSTETNGLRVTSYEDSATAATPESLSSYTQYNKYGDITEQYTKDGSLTSAVSVLTYDVNGRKLTEGYRTAADGDVTVTAAYTYDAAGNALSVTDAFGNTAYTEYDALGRKTSETDFEGAVTRYTYDTRGLLIKKVSDFGTGSESTVKYYYNAAGDLVSEKQSREEDGSPLSLWNTTEYVYDACGQVSDIIRHKSASVCEYTHYDRNAAGKVTRAVTGLTSPYVSGMSLDGLSCVCYTYNGYGETLSVTDALGASESYEYTYSGRIKKTTKRSGGYTLYGWDMFGNTVSERAYSASDTLLAENTRSYDGFGNILSASSGGVSSVYTYTLGSLASETQTGGVVKTYTADSRGLVTAFSLSVAGSTVQSLAYTYDAAGRLSSVTENGTVTYTYYTYDKNGRRVSESTPAEGILTEYTYNKAGLLTEKQSYTSLAGMYLLCSRITSAYNKDGTESRRADHRERTVISYSYDGCGRLTREAKVSDTGSVYESVYSYDARGNRTGL